MTANVWNPGQGAIPVAQSKQTMLAQAFTAIDAQVLFNLTAFNYTPYTSSLLIAINGVMQIPVVDFTETSGSSFTITSPLVAGDVVLALGFVGVTATDASLTVIKNATQLLLDSAAQKAIDAANAATAAGISAGNASTSEGNALGYKNAAAVSASQVSGAFDGMRNRIINGDMRIDQRFNGGVCNCPINANTYSIDRWSGILGPVGTFSLSQQIVGTPAIPASVGFDKFLRAYVTAANAAPGTSGVSFIQQSIEGINVADFLWGTSSAKAINVSFWIRSNVTGTFSGIVSNPAGTRCYGFNFTINAAATWQFVSVTIPGCTDGVWPIDNSAGLNFRFDLGSGTNYKTSANSWTNGNFIGVTGSVNLMSATAQYIDFTGVQLELGTAATVFQRRAYAQELILCQRYYEIFGGVAAPAQGGTNDFRSFPFKVTKRVIPSVGLLAITGTGYSFTCNDLNRCYQETLNSGISNFTGYAFCEL